MYITWKNTLASLAATVKAVCLYLLADHYKHHIHKENLSKSFVCKYKIKHYIKPLLLWWEIFFTSWSTVSKFKNSLSGLHVS